MYDLVARVRGVDPPVTSRSLYAFALATGVRRPGFAGSCRRAGMASEPLTLNAALDEALQRNPDLKVLRREYDAALAVPAVKRYLAPPSFEAQIWAWPVTTLNPIRTDMYMLTMEQVLPGRGKRAARELVGGRGCRCRSPGGHRARQWRP